MLPHLGLPCTLTRRPDPTDPATTDLGGLRPRAADAIVATAILAAYLSTPAELLAQRRVPATFPQASGPREGWLEIQPSGDSGCAFDIPYSFFVVVGGSGHGLLRTDAFYSYQADGVLLRDWVQNIVDERQVRSHRCRECGVIESPGSAEPPDSSDSEGDSLVELARWCTE